MRVALDTNVLVYAEGFGDAARCLAARKLMAQLIEQDVVLPAQTLGELSRVLTTKAGRSPEQTRQAVYPRQTGLSSGQILVEYRELGGGAMCVT